MKNAGQLPGAQAQREGRMSPGQDLVIAGYVGWEGTRRIDARLPQLLRERFAPSFLASLAQEDGYAVESWLAARTREQNSLAPVTAWKFAGEGGILAALWNLSGEFDCGVEADLRAFPLRQLTVELCECLELNPYRLLCKNCALFTADRGGALVRELREANIPAAVVGFVTEGNARRIRHGQEEAGYLERPQPDEIEKIMEEEIE